MKDQELTELETITYGKNILVPLPKSWTNADDKPLTFKAKIKNNHLVLEGPKISMGGKE